MKAIQRWEDRQIRRSSYQNEAEFSFCWLMLKTLYVFKLPCHLIPKAGLFLCVRSDTYGPVWSRGAVGAPAVPT